MKKITILGIACVDIIIKGNNNIPQPGRLEFVDAMKFNTGGCALNASLDLKKIGIPHRLMIPVAKDVYGDYIIDVLRKSKININDLIFLEDCSTSSSIVLLNSNGERSFLHHLGANSKLDISNIDLSVIDDSDILFIGGALLMPNFDGKQMGEVLKRAKSAGALTVLDVGWDPSERWLATLGEVLPYVDIFVPSIDEAIMLSGKNDLLEINTVFLEKGVKRVIIKLGDKGSAFFDENKVIIIPPVITPKVIDTTGAGDSFMSGILTGLYYGWDILKIVEFANTVGSLCVQEYGASNGIKSFNEIIEIQERYYNEKE